MKKRMYIFSILLVLLFFSSILLGFVEEKDVEVVAPLFLTQSTNTDGVMTEIGETMICSFCENSVVEFSLLFNCDFYMSLVKEAALIAHNNSNEKNQAITLMPKIKMISLSTINPDLMATENSGDDQAGIPAPATMLANYLSVNLNMGTTRPLL